MIKDAAVSVNKGFQILFISKTKKQLTSSKWHSLCKNCSETLQEMLSKASTRCHYQCHPVNIQHSAVNPKITQPNLFTTMSHQMKLQSTWSNSKLPVTYLETNVSFLRERLDLVPEHWQESMWPIWTATWEVRSSVSLQYSL